MSRLWDELLGAVIGLARASEGNEADLTDETNTALLAGLAAAPDSDGELLSACIQRIHAEKKRIIPNCYACAMPCGRTSDYDTSALRGGIGGAPALRALILSGLRNLAPALLKGGCDRETMAVIYQALVIVGLDDLSVDYLTDTAAEVGRLCQKYL